LLSLALTLGLSSGASNEIFFLFLCESLGVGPFLVLLAAFVGLAGLGSSGTKSKLLFGELSEVISVRDAVVLGFGIGGIGSAISACSISVAS
jgi:hypothetical protein